MDELVTVPGEGAHKSLVRQGPTFTHLPFGICHVVLKHRLFLDSSPPQGNSSFIRAPTPPLDLCKSSLPHLLKPCLLPADDRTSSSEPLYFSDMKNMLQAKQIQNICGCITGRLPWAFKTPIQQLSYKNLGRIKASTKASNTCSPEHLSCTRARLPQLPVQHSKLSNQIPSSNSSHLSHPSAFKHCSAAPTVLPTNL